MGRLLLSGTTNGSDGWPSPPGIGRAWFLDAYSLFLWAYLPEPRNGPSEEDLEDCIMVMAGGRFCEPRSDTGHLYPCSICQPYAT